MNLSLILVENNVSLFQKKFKNEEKKNSFLIESALSKCHIL